MHSIALVRWEMVPLPSPWRVTRDREVTKQKEAT